MPGRRCTNPPLLRIAFLHDQDPFRTSAYVGHVLPLTCLAPPIPAQIIAPGRRDPLSQPRGGAGKASTCTSGALRAQRSRSSKRIACRNCESSRTRVAWLSALPRRPSANSILHFFAPCGVPGVTWVTGCDLRNCARPADVAFLALVGSPERAARGVVPETGRRRKLHVIRRRDLVAAKGAPHVELSARTAFRGAIETGFSERPGGRHNSSCNWQISRESARLCSHGRSACPGFC
jgi:hypothetical protein